MARTPVPRRRSLGWRLLRYAGLAILFFVVAVWMDGLLVRLPDESAVASPVGERVGVLHVHTIHSDGGGTPAEVMADAQRAGLSFLAMTDHNVTVPQSVIATDPPDFALLAGDELSTDSGHFVTFGIPSDWQRPSTGNADTLLAATHAAGGVNILAHPMSHHIPWTDWTTSNFDGFEVWNGDAVWRLNNYFDIATALILYPVNPRLALLRLARTPDAEFAKWDELNAQRPVPGMCATDAHAALRVGFDKTIGFPSYSAHFSVGREHVRVGPQAGGGDPDHAGAAEILSAIMHGHSYCGIDVLYPANGFEERVTTGSVSGQSGDSLAWAGSGTIHVSVPAGAPEPLLQVFRDGQKILEQQTFTLDAPLPGPGRYRVEAFMRQPGWTGWRRWTLWIFSNPIYVNDSSAAQ